nr:acetylcholine receptor subunit beta [Crassostrea gigas]
MVTVGIRPILSLTEADLKRSLLSSAVYDPSVRPRINASHAVHVQLDVHVVYIVGLKEKESAFDQACFIYVSWRDEYLTWNTSDYDGLDSFVVQPSVVWTPDVTVYGRLDKRLGLEFGQVRVNSDGVVNTKFLGLLTTQCAMNSAHFPFDYQLCAFLLGSEIYSPKEVAMEIKSVVQLESSKNNPNWNLDNVRKIAEPPITGRFNIVFNGSRCIWGFFIWYRLSCTLSLSLSRTLFRVKLERRSPSECLCSYPSWSSCCS